MLAVVLLVAAAADVTSMEKGKKTPAFHFINSRILTNALGRWAGFREAV